MPETRQNSSDKVRKIAGKDNTTAAIQLKFHPLNSADRLHLRLSGLIDE